MSRTFTRRILLEGTRAKGIELQQGDVVKRFRARREIIVCAGTYHSPHLLLLSGIGDETDLRSWGIEPAHHLPAVGRNLQDHPSAMVVIDMDDPTSYGISLKALPRDILNIGEYLLKRTGPLASNLFETNAYIKARPDSDRADMQLVFQPARRNIKPFPIPIGHGFVVATVCLYPQSKGSVRLSGPDPFAPPLIDLALLSHPADLEFLIRGLKMARQVIAHPSFAPYRARERAPGSAITSDEQLAEYIRQTLVTVHHPGSTCRMGPAGENTVVDPELKVHGLEGLRVADASIYPRLVGGNTNASVVAIAEKAADMILGKPAPAAAVPPDARVDAGTAAPARGETADVS